MKATDLAVGFVERVNEHGDITTWLRLINQGEHTLDHNWRLYFSLGVTPTAEETRVNQVLIDGRYGYLEPTASMPAIGPHEDVLLHIEPWLFSGMTLIKRQGFHLARLEDEQETLLGTPGLVEPELQPLTKPRTPGLQVLSPQARIHKQKTLAPQGAPTEIIPAVKEYVMTGEELTFAGLCVISDEPLSGVTAFNHYLQRQGVFDKSMTVRVSVDPEQVSDYELDSDASGVEISARDEHGCYHGLQTLRQLLKISHQQCVMPRLHISDTADFAHRGLSLDIARHFASLRSMKKLLDAMSSYKMNRLHLGICNDEGWRLEIPALPALTEIGGRRAFHHKNRDGTARALVPAWGDDHHEQFDYLQTNEFIELLQYAQSRHIEIIPELNLPGHANALLRSLEATGQWQLTDPLDQSVYRSAQGHTANVVNVAMEDTYRVAGTIISAIHDMFQAAGVPLRTLHLGGDEVPAGAWLKSPACHALPDWDSEWDINKPEDADRATHMLMNYHYRRITELARSIVPDIETGFWHEMAAHGDQRSYYNVWLTEGGDRSALTEMLSKGQSIVISNASYLYLDMPYAMDANEPGLPWASYVDTEAIYRFDPLACWDISPAEAHLVQGIQAQLWSETVRTPAELDYYLFPRLLAVAERAWNHKPAPGQWSRFANALRQRELSHLEDLGIAYRLFDPE